MKRSVLLLLLVVGWPGRAQDLTGHWRGHFFDVPTPFPYRMELDLKQTRDSLRGQLRMITDDGYVLTTIHGRVKGRSVWLSEGRILKYVAHPLSYWILDDYEGVLTVHPADSTLRIAGQWTAPPNSHGRFSLVRRMTRKEVARAPAPPPPPPVPAQPATPDTSVVPDAETDFTTARANEPVVLRHVLFVEGKAELLPSSRPELDRLTRLLTDNPTLRLRIKGHTDSIGDPARNLLLSQQRALAVKRYLIRQGINEKRLTTAGYGQTRPVCQPPCQANRRVEVVIVTE